MSNKSVSLPSIHNILKNDLTSSGPYQHAPVSPPPSYPLPPYSTSKYHPPPPYGHYYPYDYYVRHSSSSYNPSLRPPPPPLPISYTTSAPFPPSPLSVNSTPRQAGSLSPSIPHRSPKLDSASSKHRKTRNNLPKETTYILLKWLNDHLNHPYPNSFEKNELMMSTGLNQQQLSNWFINARRRKIKGLKQQQKLLSDE